MSGSTFRVKPRAGLIVRDPVTYRPLAIEGEEKPKWSHEMYWTRRLRDGDVVLVEEKDQSDAICRS